MDSTENKVRLEINVAPLIMLVRGYMDKCYNYAMAKIMDSKSGYAQSDGTFALYPSVYESLKNGISDSKVGGDMNVISAKLVEELISKCVELGGADDKM